MHHQLISYENACNLIDQLDAEEIHSAEWSQTFKADRNGQPIYIQLSGGELALLISKETI
jgi:hypothetical protein